MGTSAARLTSVVREKLTFVVAKIRRDRFCHGIERLTFVTFLSPLPALFADAVLDLSVVVRGLVLVFWLIVVMASTWRFLYRPLRSKIPVESIKSHFEQRFPALAERLRLYAEEKRKADSRAAIDDMVPALLAREAEIQFMNPWRLMVGNAGESWRSIAKCIVVIGLSLSLLMIAGVERTRRIVVPWSTPLIGIGHRVVVTSGDPVVPRGAPVTLAAYLEKTRPDASVPTSVVLICRESGAAGETRVPMLGDDADAFTATRPRVAIEFDYCVEAGGVRSGWHHVRIHDTIRLIDGSGVIVGPPDYAASSLTKQTLGGLDEGRELAALQYSRARFTFCFDRPVTSVTLEWKPRDSQRQTVPGTIPTLLAEDRLRAHAEFTIVSDGTLLLAAVGDRSRTELTIPVAAVLDTPPRFERCAGVPTAAREVRTDSILTFDLVAVDDIALARFEIEYILPGDDESRIQQVPLDVVQVGGGRGECLAAFSLAGKARLGQTLRLRLRVTDGRHITDAEHAAATSTTATLPNSTTYPESGWASLKFVANALPLSEQDILARQQATHDQLQMCRRLIVEASELLTSLIPTVAGRASLMPDEAARLAEASEKLESTRYELTLLARRLDLVAASQRLGPAVRGLVDGPLARARRSIQSAGLVPRSTDRDRGLAEVQKLLPSVIQELDTLRSANIAAGEIELDRDRLERLADAALTLARSSREPQAKVVEIAARQKTIADELGRLMKESARLRQAGEADQLGRLRELADRFHHLSDNYSLLNESARRLGSGAQKDRLLELSRRQQELSRQANELCTSTETTARIAGTTPLGKDCFERMADLIVSLRPLEALAEQEKAARELDRVALAIEQAVAKGVDVRDAAKQIAGWQNDLRARLARVAAADGKTLAAEQASLKTAIEGLSLPPDTAAEPTRAEAVAHAGRAHEALGKVASDADSPMRQTTAALERLILEVPNNGQRRKAARERLDTLLKEQEGLRKMAIELATKKEPAQAEDYLRLAKRQAELALKLRHLDTPGFWGRKNRTAESALLAEVELRAKSASGITTSQDGVRRQIAWLHEAIGGQNPPDVVMADISELQRALLRELEPLLNFTPDDRKRFQRAQTEICKRIDKISSGMVSVGPGETREVRDAVDALDALLKKADTTLVEVREKSRGTIAAFDRLIDRWAAPEPATGPLPNDAPHDAENKLPSARVAQSIRDLARRQRDLRDQLARAVEASGRPQIASGQDPLAELARQQAEITARSDELAKKARRNGSPIEVAKQAARAKLASQNTSDYLRAGDPTLASRAAELTADALRAAGEAASKSEIRRAFEELHRRQLELTRQTGDADTQECTARQRNREAELARESRELATLMDRMTTTARPPHYDRNMEAMLNRFAGQLRVAAEQMDGALQHTKAGRSSDADTARRLAIRELTAAAHAAHAAGGTEPNDSEPEVRAAHRSATKAAELMKQAGEQLVEPRIEANAILSIELAAEALRRAASHLAEERN